MLDLIVVGAGLSGLQAAYSAQKKGLSVVVLEARNRVGGKVWSEPTALRNGMADLGAAWVNQYKQPRVATYLAMFGLETVEQRLGGTAIIQIASNERMEFPYGITPDFEPEEKENLAFIRDHIQAASLTASGPTVEEDSVTLDQYVRNLGALPKTVQMVNLWSRVMHGVESTQQSAAWFIDYCRRNHGLLAIRADDASGGNYQRLLAGTQALAEGIVQLLGKQRVLCHSPVTSLEDQGQSVTAKLPSGQVFTAKKAIVSIPTAMYKDISFSPPLPQRVQEVTGSTILGHYNKALLIYEQPWWRELGYNGFFMSYDRPVCLARDTSVDSKHFYALTCFINGENGHRWGQLYPHQRRQAVLNQLAFVYRQKEDSMLYRPVEYFDQIWKHEQYSQGALAPITAVGHYTEYSDVYGKPVGNLHFVGTEFSPEWKGYMEGALCSGERGGEEVFAALASNRPAKL